MASGRDLEVTKVTAVGVRRVGFISFRPQNALRAWPDPRSSRAPADRCAYALLDHPAAPQWAIILTKRTQQARCFQLDQFYRPAQKHECGLAESLEMLSVIDVTVCDIWGNFVTPV